jgi:hypothetical protein
MLRECLQLGLRPVLELVGEFHDQDAVFGNHAHQGHQPHLGIDVQRGGPALSVQKGTLGSGIFRKVNTSAPNMARGTDPARMTNGSRKLLYCAARVRKIITRARHEGRQKFVALDAQLADSPV